jgi:DNA-binding NarL/FixJ family response regulator
VKSARVLLVEDDPDTNRYLSSLIKSAETLTFASSVTSYEAAIAFLQQHDIDCLVTDIRLPDGSGVDLVRWCTDNRPAIQSLVISVLGDEKTLLTAISAGAGGYLLKDTDESKLCAAVDELMNGGAPISAYMAKHILAQLPITEIAREQIKVPDETPTLTGKETQVLEVIARGYSYKETAKALGVSPNTIPTHIKNIYRKLQVHSRGEAVCQALRLGILDDIK